MEIDLSAFHFLRPLWLLLILPGVLLPLAWQRSRKAARLSRLVAPHLLRHLLVTPEQGRGLRPVHLLGALLVLGALAAAGPTWQQDRPDFLDNRAPLILALDLSPSMDAGDVPPTRLDAAKHLLQDLVKRRAGARTGLIAYAGRAHLVLPPTEDPALLALFIDALSTDLLASPGKDVLGAIAQAQRLLAAERAPGTLLLVTDGGAARQLPRIGPALAGGELQVLVLAVGRNAAAGFDAEGLQQLAEAADAPLGSLTLDDDDLDWIELHAQQHFQAARGDREQVFWQDAGYWLCWPLLLIAFLAVRRGWSVHWLAGLLLAIGLALPAPPAQAGALADAFFTPDQQGRWAFEHGDFPGAQAHFADPYWKGLAAYQAADFEAAILSFAQLDSAEAHFYLGNSHARLYKLDAAIAAYRQALKRRPQFPEARANLQLVTALRKSQEQQVGSDLGADQVEFDKPSGKGQDARMTQQQASADELWLHNLSTSPAQFLKQKFRLQDAAETGSRP